MHKEKIPIKVFAAIFATGILSFCGVIIETSMNISFPTLMKQFNISTNVVSWMTSIYLLAISIIVPLSANLKASFKTKNLFIVANILFLIGVLIDALAPSFGLLLLGRVIEGIGTGISLPLMFNIIMEQVPQSRVGTMMGVGNMITGIAPAVGPVFGGIIVTSLGWRWIFLILIPIVFISLLLGIWGIEQKSKLHKAKFDALSIIFVAIFFIGMIYGFSNLSSYNFISIQVLGAIIAGLLGLGMLIWRSHGLENPILNLSLFKSASFSAHTLSFFMIQVISLGNAFLLPNFIQLVNGNTALIAGLIVLPAGFAGAVMGPIGGKVYDEMGARRPILIGLTFMVASMLIFSLISLHMSNLIILFVYILYMGGMGTTLGIIMTDTLEPLNKFEVPQGNAILNTAQQFAGAVGTSLTSAIVAFSQAATHSKSALSTAQGTQYSYIFLTILAIIIFVLMFKYTKKKEH
ncbi:EmrB/QacA subfamily drug resistance transporter [Lactobacillus colini]|uniref:EmrB/QacA subfamily drug resistance transporter n=1 Tax=Lactobacillus colini TaxID=1819254 RepID=A0ABS4MCX6_9LACO|nr:MFS transporter [Lactobacillus colini]MBP2057181.1 EmrB/QacA subfamily drug resistance transporter [Lactobacillus colini]